MVVLSVAFRGNIRKLTPVLAIAIGCIFILRGLNLGIPYLSPSLSHNHSQVEDCCKPKEL